MRLQDRLVSSLLRSEGVEEAPSQFSQGMALWVDGREFLHFHEGHVEIRLTRAMKSAQRARLKADHRVNLRSADWVEVRLARANDLALATELAELALDANRRKPGERARRPLDDREIARRRRTHRLPTDDLGRP